MEPEAVRAHCCVFAILIFLGHYCSPPIFRPHKVPFWTLKGFDPDPYRVSPSTTIVVDLGPL